MKDMLQNLSSQYPKSQLLSLDYRPPRWESPIEQKLWYALRYMGIGVETQVSVGDYRVDMIVFSRLSPNEVIIECDGANFHHNMIDEFRDDELIEIARLPIAHISGKEIAKSPERCALYIAERWFPRIMDTLGYAATVEMVYGEEKEIHVEGTLGFFPVGKIRPIVGDLYPSHSIHRYRYYLRYIVGNISECDFVNKEEQERVEEWKTEFAKLDFPKRKFTPQELVRFYILFFYQEPELSNELQRLDNFLENLKRINQIKESANGEGVD
jgi:very-short-patch-repair endonuclease